MNDRLGEKSLQELKKAQLQLNGQIAMLQEESRRLRDEIAKAQVTHKTFSSNLQNINSARLRIGSLQKKIHTELEKLAVVTPSPVAENETLPMAPPPPPASPSPSPPYSPKTGVLKSGKSNAEQPKKSEDVTGNLFKEINAGKKLKSGKDSPAQKSEQEESVLYESSIHRKENEVKRLVEQLNNLLVKFETEKAIALEYEVELEKQTELILELQEIETSLEEQFNKVQEEIGTELLALEEQKALVKQEQLAAHDALLKKEETQSAELTDPPSATPPPTIQAPPAPTFAPVSNSFKLKVKAVKVSAGESVEPDLGLPPQEASASPRGTVDTGEIASRARESQNRREALEIKDYMAAKLIELVAEESVTEDGEMSYSPEQQKLISSLGEEGYQQLKAAMVLGLEDELSDTVKGLAHRRAALNRTPQELALIAGLKDKAKLKDKVTAFIDNNGQNNLFETGKGMKQAEEALAQKAFEAQQKEEARKKEERDAELASAQKIKAEEKAVLVQSELAKLGIKQGVAKTDIVELIAAQKAVQAQSESRLGLKDVAAFLKAVEKDLSTKIELFKAAALQEIETAAMQAPGEDAPLVPEVELTEVESVEQNVLEEAQMESTEQVTFDFDAIERDLSEVERHLVYDANHQFDLDLQEIEQGLDEIDQHLLQEASRQLALDLQEIEQSLDQLDQQLAQEASRQLELDLLEVEQGLDEIDQHLAQETDRQLEQNLAEIEQGLREIEQQLAKPQSKPVEQTGHSHLTTHQRKESNSRYDLLEKSGFNTNLDEIKKAADHFAKNKKPFAEKEMNILHGKLLQARDAFVKTGNVDQFSMASNRALAKHETRYIAQNEGVIAWLKRTIKSLQDCVESVANKAMGDVQTKQIQMPNNENLDPNAVAKGKEIPEAVHSMKSALKKLHEVNTSEEPEERRDLHL